ncbi:hypothetical protein EDB85DRAFT_1234068 [Lactarius pseudohatsudake]|nr:hypothetical protein EDB85DRAFT_1234068 [Lactarius pseudohatsudake]
MSSSHVYAFRILSALLAVYTLALSAFARRASVRLLSSTASCSLRTRVSSFFCFFSSAFCAFVNGTASDVLDLFPNGQPMLPAAAAASSRRGRRRERRLRGRRGGRRRWRVQTHRGGGRREIGDVEEDVRDRSRRRVRLGKVVDVGIEPARHAARSDHLAFDGRGRRRRRLWPVHLREPMRAFGRYWVEGQAV